MLPLLLSLSATSTCALPSPSSQPLPAAPQEQPGIQKLFQEGEAALQSGDLVRAEAAFRRVVSRDPQSAGAYSNLGVIAMRRQQWPEALAFLKKAERLAPQVSGIRLNIGLAYLKQGDYHRAIPPFESVLRDAPASHQARYLLGLSYFFIGRAADATRTLEPLWPQELGNMNYLYVLGIAAHYAGKTELEDRALSRLLEIGQNTPEFHLLMGKAYLNRRDNEQAIAEFRRAAQADPKLPFVHFNIGVALLRKGDFPAARDEFLKDIVLEPDVAFNYDQLGTVYTYLEQEAEAEKYFREALQRDAHLASSHYGLAKIYQNQGKYERALQELDAAEKLVPDNSDIRYVRGQVLRRLGRKEEAAAEMKRVSQILGAQRHQKPQQQEMLPLPSLETTAEPQ